jgi:hypothetical protein
MRFIREVPLKNLTDKIKEDLIKEGYKLIFKTDSVEIWADCSPDAIEG